MNIMSRLLAAWVILTATANCSGKTDHDLDLAIKRALEFVDTTFVRHDREKGYNLLADKTRSYVSFTNFKETVSMIPCNDYSAKLTVNGAAPPSPDENLVNVVLSCEGENNSTHRITVTLAGTAATDYKVTKFVRWAVPLPPSG